MGHGVFLKVLNLIDWFLNKSQFSSFTLAKLCHEHFGNDHGENWCSNFVRGIGHVC